MRNQSLARTALIGSSTHRPEIVGGDSCDATEGAAVRPDAGAGNNAPLRAIPVFDQGLLSVAAGVQVFSYIPDVAAGECHCIEEMGSLSRSWSGDDVPRARSCCRRRLRAGRPGREDGEQDKDQAWNGDESCVPFDVQCSPLLFSYMVVADEKMVW